MNVTQELGYDELYNYDILVKLLGYWFDPESRVSASQSRFYGRLRRHHEDADSFADVITDLCHVSYPQSSPKFRQELISEQFVRGQSDPELKKVFVVGHQNSKGPKTANFYWSLHRFTSLSNSPNIHRPAEKVFAVDEDSESEDMFPMADRHPWTGQQTLQQMFALARKMGYEMPPIARRLDNTCQLSGSPRAPFTTGLGYRPPFRPGHDFSKIKCFSCGQFIQVSQIALLLRISGLSPVDMLIHFTSINNTLYFLHMEHSNSHYNTDFTYTSVGLYKTHTCLGCHECTQCNSYPRWPSTAPGDTHFC